jgi:hypothetical protein
MRYLGEKEKRVSGLILFQDLEVEPGDRRTSGITYPGNGLSFFYFSALGDKIYLVISIYSFEIILMFEDKEITISF